MSLRINKVFTPFISLPAGIRVFATVFIYIYVLLMCFSLHSCAEDKQEKIVTPWGEVGSEEPAVSAFTVSDIVAGGELIALTMTGPDTYYDYRGHGMGTQYLLCERFARRLGVSLRIELCRDTAEMVRRLEAGDADLIAFPLPKTVGKGKLLFCGAGVDSLNVQWAVSRHNVGLADSLNAWFRPSLFADVEREERYVFSSKSVKRHVYAPFLDRGRGVISKYDHLFKRYAPAAGCDWRLIAAQCYQESCFDPKARSWAGACGLMQIMPATAEHLGLPWSDVYNPEQNVSAAARYLRELSGMFTDVAGREDRMLFVLASYNGGYHHVKDARSLARKNGKNPDRWRDVAPYVLALERPEFYNDPVVKNGYMRGSETVGYVDGIRQRYAQYRGVPYGGASVKSDDKAFQPHSSYSPFEPRRAKRQHRFKL